jgi:hypothetical protein
LDPTRACHHRARLQSCELGPCPHR